MRLIQALEEINSQDDHDELMTVYAKKEWNIDSTTRIAKQPENGKIEPVDGLSYFLEVFIIKELLEEFNEKEVSKDMCEKIIRYAMEDA